MKALLKTPGFVRSLLFACFFFFSLNATAQSSESVSLEILPDHSQWIYKKGESAIFNISVRRGQNLLRGVKVHIEIGQEKMPAAINKDTVLKNGFIQIRGGSLDQPGFLRCIVTAEIDGKKIRTLVTAAYEPDSIAPTTETPADFLTFWDSSMAALNKVPLDSKMRLLPERCTDKLNVYEISVQNIRAGSRIYGILCMPKKPGKYPAVLKLPGAGVRAYNGDMALANKGIITLEIGIHGVPVTMPNQVYYDLAFGPLHEYYFSNLDNRDRYYYKRVYMGCLRSVDFLASLEQVDTSRIAVYGGSQGGALSIVTAALDKRVKYVASLYPALSDMPGYFHGRAGGWPHMFAPNADTSLRTSEKIKTASYYDVVNFAKRIKIPGLYLWGFNDEVCPPTSIYAVFNSITAPKEKFITKASGHWLTPEQDVKVKEWLLEKLQVRP